MFVRQARLVILGCCVTLVVATVAEARNPIRRTFFARYPAAETTQLDDLLSNAGHCGVCHFDFDGGGPRNPYGVSVEARLAAGLSNAEAIADVEFEDADNDGFSNYVEITDTANFSNTPSFPGFKAANYLNAVNVDHAELAAYLTPSGATDLDPPVVTVSLPAGGEVITAETTTPVAWTAMDAGSGVSVIHIDHSSDGGLHWKRVAQGLPNTGSYDLFMPHLPGAGLLRVVAVDNATNEGYGNSAGFTVTQRTGVAPTTLRDFDLPGTQPFAGGVAEDPSVTCISCHGDYDASIEHYANWQGSMMAQAMRDPLYIAMLRVVDELAPSAGDLCLRCHTPSGWAEGRSLDTKGGNLIAKDLIGVNCDFCHSLVDPVYDPLTAVPGDSTLLAGLDAVPVASANGQFVIDPDPLRRGPYTDANASHQFVHSPFTLSANLCGTCHDVSNPVFVKGDGDFTYDVQALDAPHPDGDPRNMFPIERTFSEWSVSDYANGGVYQPQFAGDRPDGMVGTCQDCHMRDVTGAGCTEPGAPNRTDLGLHDMTGGNTFLPDILPDFYPGEVDVAQLQAGKLRARAMLTLAATLDVTPDNQGGNLGINVRVTNETGHKLPSGYPEGRRIWLNVQAFNGDDQIVYESGHYDAATGELAHDAEAKIYHIEPGISTRLADLLGVEAGPSFAFALNDSVYLDNRIPPRGFTNASFIAVQSAPVAYAYADGQYWDDTHYDLPTSAVRAEVSLYYQTTSKEFVEFLRDNNHTDSAGQDLYDAWVAHGRSVPELMAQASVALDPSGTGDGGVPHVTSLAQNYPNPFNPQTWIEYSLAAPGPVSLKVFDGRGHLVRTLLGGAERPAGPDRVLWTGTDDAGRHLASGVYYYVLETSGRKLTQKMTLVR
jgi:hypothetical protein